ncbi:hypothetical protein WALSEDRAFT_61408 [Wallemia mellicola CBS 633.66]|uniref:DNA-directed RNA polymerase III subunit RPC9 n=2 Tax=Wallemia mellicola TaxID=1708541 RepID=I4Y6L4_WALMC|nr:hypothetical protein WALSEDRAFT_61408 [Wallemia mellicola CBS 633.66]EIM19606.1 hypothetical protein WALSEDRAFT_61408 [Wallemia mellicola CBS 633.66]|eukprot:XP_006960404.1 hypothetical protein WALSEDRAFT_61408 [Wallemia mellicola CBS 633.66]
MEVLNARVGHLSNFEVFEIIKELGSSTVDNLRFTQTEAVKYLSNDNLSTTKQNETGITNLLQSLEQFQTLTRAEKLMIVNLSPKSVVELYVIIEELEDRLSEEDIEAILSLVSTNLGETTNLQNNNNDDNGPTDEPLFVDEDEQENAKYEQEIAEQEELENADVGEEEARGIDEVDD